MQRYRVILNGKNFLLRLGEDGPKKCGFYATRWIKAADEREAESAAVDLVRGCGNLKRITLNQQEDVPMIFLDQISLVGWWEYFRRNPGGGYTFYPEDINE